MTKVSIGIHGPVSEELDNLLACGGGTSAVRQLLSGSAGEGHSSEGEDNKVCGGVFERREVVDVVEEGGHVEAHDTLDGQVRMRNCQWMNKKTHSHEITDAEDSTGDVKSKTCA